MAVQAEERNNKQSKGSKVLIIVLIVVVVLLIGVIAAFAAFYIKNQKKSEEKDEKRQVLVTEDTVEEVVDDLFEEPEEKTGVPTSVDVMMNTTWHFPDGESPSSDAYVENSKQNQTDMYFDVKLTDTQETIYESPIIPLGGKLNEIKLMKDLDPGTYDCELTYHLIDEEQNTLGTVVLVVTIIVDN